MSYTTEKTAKSTFGEVMVGEQGAFTAEFESDSLFAVLGASGQAYYHLAHFKMHILGVNMPDHKLVKVSGLLHDILRKIEDNVLLAYSHILFWYRKAHLSTYMCSDART